MAMNTVNANELTQEQVNTLLLTPLATASVFEACGPQVINTASPMRFPAMGNASTVNPSNWVGENQVIPTADPDIVNEVSVMPSTMRSIKVLTQYSNELVRQSAEAGIGLESLIQSKLVSDVAKAIDERLFSAYGDGVTTPQGIFGWAGTQVVDTNGTLTLDMLLDGDLLFMNTDGLDYAAAKLVTTPAEFTKIRKLKDASGRYLVIPDATSAGGYTILGHKVIVTKHAAGTALVDFSKVVYAKDAAPSVKLLDQTFGNYDQQAIRVTYRCDAKPLDPAAVVVFKDVA